MPARMAMQKKNWSTQKSLGVVIPSHPDEFKQIKANEQSSKIKTKIGEWKSVAYMV